MNPSPTPAAPHPSHQPACRACSGIPSLIARLILGGVFIYMGIDKAKDPGTFLKLIREYHMMPDSSYVAMNTIAAVLPWLEIFCGVMLFLGVAIRGTALLLLIILIGFTGAVALRAYHIYGTQHIPFCTIKFDCGCGSGEVYICKKIAENSGLILLSIFLLVARPVTRWCTLWPRLISTRNPLTSNPRT